jgi:hypothetical protein
VVGLFLQLVTDQKKYDISVFNMQWVNKVIRLVLNLPFNLEHPVDNISYVRSRKLQPNVFYVWVHYCIARAKLFNNDDAGNEKCSWIMRVVSYQLTSPKQKTYHQSPTHPDSHLTMKLKDTPGLNQDFQSQMKTLGPASGSLIFSILGVVSTSVNCKLIRHSNH